MQHGIAVTMKLRYIGGVFWSPFCLKRMSTISTKITL